MIFSKRRSDIQIIGKILDLSKEGAKKTEILYQTNMNFNQLQNYLSFLLDKKVIRENIIWNDDGSSNKTYLTTKKGDNLLEDINNLYTYFE